MKRRRNALAALGWLALLSPTASAQIDGTIAACEACHGPDGISQMADVPTIAGLSALVLEDALYAYREGDRQCGTSSWPALNMCAPASSLDEDLIADLAEHYASLSFAAADQPFDAAKAAEGEAIHTRDCEICHAQGGREPGDDTSVLAGQHMSYLRHALTEYRAGERAQPRAMEVETQALSTAEIEALLNYYASQQ